MNEADTCRKYVVPRLEKAGWDSAPHSFTEQRTFTDGRILPIGNKVKRGKQKRADYLLCHVAFNAPLRTRRERADRLLKNKQDFFDQFGTEARDILLDLVQKYASPGIAQFSIPDVLKVPPISDRGNISEIISAFGGADRLRAAVGQLQAEIYAA